MVYGLRNMQVLAKTNNFGPWLLRKLGQNWLELILGPTEIGFKMA